MLTWWCANWPQPELLYRNAATDDHFGCSVAVSGMVIPIGICFEDDNGGNNDSSGVDFDLVTLK